MSRSTDSRPRMAFIDGPGPVCLDCHLRGSGRLLGSESTEPLRRSGRKPVLSTLRLCECPLVLISVSILRNGPRRSYTPCPRPLPASIVGRRATRSTYVVVSMLHQPRISLKTLSCFERFDSIALSRVFPKHAWKSRLITLSRIQ